MKVTATIGYFKFRFMANIIFLSSPILYLSKYINAHKKEYYDLLIGIASSIYFLVKDVSED